MKPSAAARVRSALLGLTLLLGLGDTRPASAQNGNVLIQVVDDLAPTSWSDARGSYCPPGWEPLEGMLVCKHFSTLNRLSPRHQRVLEAVTVTAVGLACPQAYQKVGDALCARFGALSAADVYTPTADVSYGGTYANAGEGSAGTLPTCNPGWDLVSHPYQGGIGMCLRRITVLIQVPPNP